MAEAFLPRNFKPQTSPINLGVFQLPPQIWHFFLMFCLKTKLQRTNNQQLFFSNNAHTNTVAGDDHQLASGFTVSEKLPAGVFALLTSS